MAGIWQVILLLAIAGSFALRLLFLQLPVHMDEYDYLFIGRQLINGDSWPSLSYVFGADFNWYLFAWFDHYIDGICAPGICGPRLLAGLLGTTSLAACFLFTRSLSGSVRAALLATLMLAFSAPHSFISHITTYDVIAFTLFSWSLALTWLMFSQQPGNLPASQYTVKRWLSTLALFISALLTLAAAALSKYIVLLLLPWLFLISLVMTPVLALTGALLLSAVLTAYYLFNRNSLHTLIETQLNGVHGANVSRAELAEQMIAMLGLPIMTLVVAAVIVTALRLYQRQQLKTVQGLDTTAIQLNGLFTKKTASIVILVLLACTLPIYHFVTLNRIAFAKHLVYSHIIILPLLAWLLILLYDHFRHQLQKSLLPNVAILAFVSLFGFSNTIQLLELKRGYPDMAELVDLWAETHDPGEATGRILSEDPYLFRYLQGHGTDQALISETMHLDNDLDGQFTEQDVVDALWDRKYRWVLLTDQIHPAKNQRYRYILKLRSYRPVFNHAYHLSGTLSGNHLGNVQLFKYH